MELEIPTAAPFEPLLADGLRYLGAKGGRGSGKSHFFAGLAIERSLMGKFDLVCIRENQKSLQQSVKKLLEEKIASLGVGQYFEVLDDKIRSVHGGVIIFQGMKSHSAESIKSLEGYDAAWIEEAQTLSQTSLDMLRPTLRKDGSQIWFSWNPRSPEDPVDVFLGPENPPPRSCVVVSNYVDNPWLSPSLVEEAEYDKARDPAKYRHVWLGEYLQNDSARVFNNWLVEECEPPPGTVLRFGADWGFSIDPSVLVRCWISEKRLYVDYEAYMVGCEVDNLPSLFGSCPDSDRWPIVADSARPETIAYMRRHGYPKIFPAVKGARSLEEGVEFLKSFDIVVHPRCEHVIRELQMYSYKTDPLTDKVLPVLEDKDNHCLDALRYAMEGARRAQKASGPAKRPIIPKLPAPAGGWMG